MGGETQRAGSGRAGQLAMSSDTRRADQRSSGCDIPKGQGHLFIMTNNKVPAAGRQAHLKTSGVFKSHQREEVSGLWHLETRGSRFLSHGSPLGAGDKAKPCAEPAFLSGGESPRRARETHHGGARSWASHDPCHSSLLPHPYSHGGTAPGMGGPRVRPDGNHSAVSGGKPAAL